MSSQINLRVKPRESVSWDEFVKATPVGSIALDGYVRGPPNYDESTMHLNFDHHSDVTREATMSTCKQVLFALKGNMMRYVSQKLKGNPVNVFINDTDQDTALAVWLLENSKLFEGTQGIPHINRLVELTDRLDITGGAFPMNLRDELVEQHNWIFEPYTNLRVSGALANADASVMRDNIESVLGRINAFMMNQGGRKPLDTRHEILYESPFGFKIVNEIGGNEARYHLFSQGMDSFLSLVSTRADGKKVWTVGRRSRYVPFPVRELYAVYNKAEGLTSEDGWNGSDIIGGSSRKNGSHLDWEPLARITEIHLKNRYGEAK